MKLLIFLFSAQLLIGCTPISKLYVKYGEAGQELNKLNDGVLRFYFDREGTLYPDTLIKDKVVRKNDSRLNYLYSRNPALFRDILTRYNISPDADTLQLQQELIDRAANDISKTSVGRKLVFIIHGFNKHPLRPSEKSSSYENSLMRKKITENYPTTSFQFVEIYWDGCTWKNGFALLSPFNSFKIWDNAQPASNAVGLELRRILFKITQPDVFIISHSLGASVATCALFNTDKFGVIGSDGLVQPNPFRESILKKYTDTMSYRTPLANIRLGMLAPAIPGGNTFDEFNDRTPETKLQSTNYSILIGYNRYDPVLRKYLGLPGHLGATTLGCLPAEVDSVKKLINADREIVTDIDFSHYLNNDRQKEHAFAVYIANKGPMDLFLRSLFE